MRLNHFGLPVRDVERSRRFYETYFEFNPATARMGNDTVTIRNSDGFALTFHGGHDVGPLPAPLHFGFELLMPEGVTDLLTQMQADGVVITKRYEDPGFVSFTCTDPDGHQIETYWEVSGALTGF